MQHTGSHQDLPRLGSRANTCRASRKHWNAPGVQRRLWVAIGLKRDRCMSMPKAAGSEALDAARLDQPDEHLREEVLVNRPT